MMVLRAETLENRRILVVEDDIVLRMVLAGHLRKLGGLVDEAGTLADARRALLLRAYDAVVADIHLPDGIMLEVAHEIHERMPELRFIFITGDVNRTLFEEALQDHPAAYLIKPFELLELDAALVHALHDEPLPATSRHTREGNVADALLALGAQRVVLRTNSSPRRRPIKLYARLAVAGAGIVIAAFAIGYALHDPSPREDRDSEPRIIYVPTPVPTPPQ